jgi:hypothetical protein
MLQLCPDPKKPSLHVQFAFVARDLHLALASQFPFFFAQKLMALQVSPSPVKFAKHVQTRCPGPDVVQFALASQLPLFSKHRSMGLQCGPEVTTVFS